MVKQQNLQQQLDLDKISENSDDVLDQTLAQNILNDQF